jgi:hypothetical protein
MQRARVSKSRNDLHCDTSDLVPYLGGRGVFEMKLRQSALPLECPRCGKTVAPGCWTVIARGYTAGRIAAGTFTIIPRTPTEHLGSAHAYSQWIGLTACF